MQLDAATVLLQLVVGGLLGCWLTTRRREVGLGYGWLLRLTFLLLALLAVIVGRTGQAGSRAALVRDAGAAAAAVAALVALAVSITRRRAGVSGQRTRRRARAERVAVMTGRPVRTQAPVSAAGEFPPMLDLAAPAVGTVGLLGAASVAGGPYALAAVRIIAGAVFLGLVTDAMLLGHWYLVQPGLGRGPVKELVAAAAAAWVVEVLALLWPTGMVQVLDGSVDDGAGGLLGWTWAVCAVTTIALLGVTRLALKERSYSAVMAATGLLYLAILTAFGTDLVARAVLNP